MKNENTIIIVVIAGIALLFWAMSKGLISSTGLSVTPSGQQVGLISVPQPTQNYSGYLAATTAPAVSSAVNTAVSGLSTGVNHLFSAWFGQSTPTPYVNQGPVAPAASAPSAAAQPMGPITPVTTVGPQIPSDISYAATAGSAFDYTGLANANSWDSTYALQDPGLLSA